MDPIYRQEVYFLLGGTAQELREYFLKAHGISPSFADNTGGLEWKHINEKTGDVRFYLWLEDPDTFNLTHETLHLTFDVMREVGVEPGEETEEAYCYLQEFYFRQMMQAIQDIRKRA